MTQTRILPVIVVLVCAMAAPAQRLNRPTPRKAKVPSAAAVALPAADTVVAPPVDSVVVVGFDKPCRVGRETMFVVNNTSRHIDDINFTINYFDMQQRRLHAAGHTVGVDVPPGETRLITVQSFDRNGMFYYHLSEPGPANRPTTPFYVEVEVKYITHPIRSPQ